MGTIEKYVICDEYEYNYLDLIPGILEICSRYSMISKSAIKDVNVAFNYAEYTRPNAYLTSNPMSSNSAGLRIEDGNLIADEFCIAGDLLVNSEGKMMVAESPDPLFGDLLAYSYMLMDRATPWLAIAAIQGMFLLIRIYNENLSASLTPPNVSGVTPYEI
ncbi:MAG TPA: hypothetical protein PKI15_08670 [Candidatus Cloacimonadota bacterium]|nr:hypothetical protein [Candidatus Cloacimonadota bacterium]